MIGRNIKRLFLAHRRELQAYLTERLRDRDVAGDLVQEIFLRFVERGADTAVIHDRSYLYRMARNLAIDHVRRVDRQRTDVVTHEDLADIREDAPGPEQVLEARQRLGHLRAAILELPERTRQVFVLYRIEGLTYGEVAERLGISDSSVQKHLAKALRHVMQRMKPD